MKDFYGGLSPVCTGVALLALNFSFACGTAAETSCSRGGLAAMSTNGSCMLQQTVAGEKVHADENDKENLEWQGEEAEKQELEDIDILNEKNTPNSKDNEMKREAKQKQTQKMKYNLQMLIMPNWLTKKRLNNNERKWPNKALKTATESEDKLLRLVSHDAEDAIMRQAQEQKHDLQLEEDTKTPQCSPAVKQQLTNTRQSAMAYVQAVRDLGAEKSDAYTNLLDMFEEKIKVSDPVGSKIVTEKTGLMKKLRATMYGSAGQGFDIKVHGVAVAAPTFAAIVSTVTLKGSTTSFKRAEIIEFGVSGKIKFLAAHWYVGPLSGQRAVTSGWIHNYFQTMGGLANGAASINDYLKLYDDDVVASDPLGTGLVQGKKALLQHVASLMSKMPKGVTTTNHLKVVNVGTDEYSGCALTDVEFSNGDNGPTILCFEFTHAGQIKTLNSVYHFKEFC